MTAHELNHFFHDEVGICGCGNPETVAILFRDVLRCAPFYEQDNRLKLHFLLATDGLFYLVLGVLQNLDLIEHGSIIDGAWLTAKGQDVLGSLETLSLSDPELESIFKFEVPPDDCQTCYPKQEDATC